MLALLENEVCVCLTAVVPPMPIFFTLYQQYCILDCRCLPFQSTV